MAGEPATSEQEIERLRRIEKAARAYFRGYCQDEAEERDLCISDRHHADAQELRDALAHELDARIEAADGRRQRG